MKKLLLLLVLLSVLLSCGGRKQIEKQLQLGNYDNVISNALKKLKKNKSEKKKQQYVLLLKDAYEQVVKRDSKTINHFKKDGNPALLKSIFELYVKLDTRQDAIKPYLPLNIGSHMFKLNFIDYSKDIIEYKFKVSNHVFNNGVTLLSSKDKYDARKAYELFSYIEGINPNFRNTRKLIKNAHQKGIDHVIINLFDTTDQIIPKYLKEGFININNATVNHQWIQYHNLVIDSMNYDYKMNVDIKRILISPEALTEKQFIRKKEIIDGWEYQLDTDGNVMKDSLGNDIKIDKVRQVRARFFAFNQFKTSEVIADVTFVNLKTNTILKTIPLDSKFVFENNFATYNGDVRALTQYDKVLTRGRSLYFPTNEQMIFDSSANLRLQLINVMRHNKLN
jgi:hypothetical protein